MLAQVETGVGRQRSDGYTAAFFAPDVAAHCYTALPVRVQLPATVETVAVPAVGSRVHLHQCCLGRRCTAFNAVCTQGIRFGPRRKDGQLLVEVTCLASESIANKSTHTRPRVCNPPNTICHKAPAMATTCNTRPSHLTTMSLSRLRAMLET